VSGLIRTYEEEFGEGCNSHQAERVEPKKTTLRFFPSLLLSPRQWGLGRVKSFHSGLRGDKILSQVH
jgi:hypothetical protein